MIAWNAILLDEHCSSWTVVQLLEWLNHSPMSWLRTKRAWRFHLADGEVLFPDGHVRGSSADQVQIKEITEVLCQKRRWLPFCALRYCPACIRGGRHYRYQQDHRFRFCIVHLKRLREGCPVCGNDIDTKGVRIHGYVCSRCKQSLLFSDNPELRASNKMEVEAAVHDDLERWQWEAEMLHVGYQRAGTGHAFDLWHGLSLNSHSGVYWRALSLAPNQRVAAALEPAPISFRTFPTSPLSAPAQPRWSEGGAVNDALDPYRSLLKAVSRHLRRTHLRGHGACCRYAIGAMGGLRRKASPEVSIAPGLCCLGQAYALWRLQWNSELQQMSIFLAHSSDGADSNAFRLPNLGAAQLSLVSSFQHWVDVLAQIQGAFTEQRERVLLNGVFDTPHWALLQEGALYSCPMHFRHPNLSLLGRCDRGQVRRREHERLFAMRNQIERARAGSPLDDGATGAQSSH